MFVTVFTSDNQAEAFVVRDLLEAQGIRAFVDDAFTVTTYQFLSPALGGIKVQVLAAKAETARAIVAQAWSDGEAGPAGEQEDPTPAEKPDPGIDDGADQDPEGPCPHCGSARLISYRPLACLALIVPPLFLAAAWKRRKCLDCGRTFR